MADFLTLTTNPQSYTPPGSGAVDTVNAYLMTRNASGAIMPCRTVYYRLVHTHQPGAFDMATQSVVSSGNGVALMPFMRDSWYQYWRGIQTKTVFVTADTPNPYELPEVSGE